MIKIHELEPVPIEQWAESHGLAIHLVKQKRSRFDHCYRDRFTRHSDHVWFAMLAKPDATEKELQIVDGIKGIGDYGNDDEDMQQAALRGLVIALNNLTSVFIGEVAVEVPLLILK